VTNGRGGLVPEGYRTSLDRVPSTKGRAHPRVLLNLVPTPYVPAPSALHHASACDHRRPNGRVYALHVLGRIHGPPWHVLTTLQPTSQLRVLVRHNLPLVWLATPVLTLRQRAPAKPRRVSHRMHLSKMLPHDANSQHLRAPHGAPPHATPRQHRCRWQFLVGMPILKVPCKPRATPRRSRGWRLTRWTPER
jgi:hypothetical protein